MRKKTVLDSLDLPSEVKAGIKSRSAMLGKTLRTMSEEDLIQDGLCLVYGILKDKPTAPILYLMKAINNHYSSLQDKEVSYKKMFTSISDSNVERALETRAYRAFNRVPKEESEPDFDSLLAGGGDGITDAIVILSSEGKSFKDIADTLGMDVKTVRRLLQKHGKTN